MSVSGALEAQSVPQPGLKKPLYGTLCEDEAAEVCRAFGVGDLVRLSQLGGGLANVNFLLTTSQGLFVIKLCFAKNYEELQV